MPYFTSTNVIMLNPGAKSYFQIPVSNRSNRDIVQTKTTSSEEHNTSTQQSLIVPPHSALQQLVMNTGDWN